MPNPTDIIQGLLQEIDQNTCTHDYLMRGGTLWTICEECGRTWADDKGGFQPHKDSEAVKAACAFLEQTPPETDLRSIGLNATLPPGYQYGDDAIEQVNLGKRIATDAILSASRRHP